MEKKAVRAAYGEALVKLGEKNDRVVVLDADLASATMTGTFKKAFPERFYDCGIAEANMVDMAAYRRGPEPDRPRQLKWKVPC